MVDREGDGFHALSLMRVQVYKARGAGAGVFQCLCYTPPMSKNKNATEKLFPAIEILATGLIDIYSRLADAHSKCLAKLEKK